MEMIRQTADEYLSQIRRFDEIITTLQDETEALYAEMAGISSPALSADKVQTSGNLASPQERIMPKYLKTLEAYRQKINRYLNLRRRMVEQINELGDWRYSRILYLTYIQGRHSSEIGYQMGYSAEWIRYLRMEALKAFEEKYL